jgi:hypothetical protein
MHYWDGQPVRFVCCERKREGEEGDASSDVPWGRVLWCMTIELAPDEQEPPQAEPHAQSESRTANAAINGTQSHYPSGDGDDLTGGVD